jgi:hypothetical protein
MTAVSQNLSIVLPLRAELWSGSPTKTRLPKPAHEAAGLPKQNGRMETHCLAGHTRLELRNVGANYSFERSHRFVGIQANASYRRLFAFELRCWGGAART